MSNVPVATNVNTLLTAKLRKRAYVVYAFLGFLLGATQTVYWSLEMGQPKWLLAALAVYAYTGVSFGLVAGNNVDKKDSSHNTEDYHEEIPSDSVLAGAEPDAVDGDETLEEPDAVDSNNQPVG